MDHKLDTVPRKLQLSNHRLALIKDAQASRAARARGKLEASSALKIQRIYRGWVVRTQTYALLLTEWVKCYGPKVVDTSWIPSEKHVIEALLPILFIFTSRDALREGHKSAKLETVLKLPRQAVPALSGCVSLCFRYISAVQKGKTVFPDSQGSVSIEPPKKDQFQECAAQLARLIRFLGKIGCEIVDLKKEVPGLRLLLSASLRLIGAMVALEDIGKAPVHPLKQHSVVFRNCIWQQPGLVRLGQKLLVRAKGTGPHQVTEMEIANYISALHQCASLQEYEEGLVDRKWNVFTAGILGVPALVDKLPPKCLNRFLDRTTMEMFCHRAGKDLYGMLIDGEDHGLRYKPWRMRIFANILALLDRSFQNEDNGKLFEHGIVADPSSPQAADLRHITTCLLEEWTFALFAEDCKPSESFTDALEELQLLQHGSFLSRLRAILGTQNFQLFLEFMALTVSYLESAVPENGNEKDTSSQPIVNALAFGCKHFVPQAWRVLATELGMPLDAPRGAVRGWDIPTLRKGYLSLNQKQQGMLGLFCRVFYVQLFIQDDDEFYRDESSLGYKRAVATALNTLVYNEFCLRRSSGKVGDLARFAPPLLRSLYERNVRRDFCPPHLWLAPYLAGKNSEDSAGKTASVSSRLEWAMNYSGAYRPARTAFDHLLDTAPQCIPFQERLDFYRKLISAFRSCDSILNSAAPLKIKIRRTHILDDAFAKLYQADPAALKGSILVTFVDEHGMTEAGIDQGGLFREFLEEVVRLGFQSQHLMSMTPDGLAFPHPAAVSHPQGEAMFEFLGTILARMLLEGMLLDYPLAPFFVARLQGRLPFFDELGLLDAELHKNLLLVKRYEGDVEDLGLTFAVDDNTLGRVISIPLMDGGAQVPVTNTNKLLYVQLLTDWHLIKRMSRASAAFARGMNKVIPAAWLNWFNPMEVNALLTGGDSQGVDAVDLANHTSYSNGYSASSSTVKLFWKVFKEMSPEDRKAVLRFATSQSRAPLGGFAHLDPPFTIHMVPCGASALAFVGGKDVDRLPSASTCFNMLKLPNYRRESTLRNKLLAAVHSKAGFDFS